MTRRRSPKQAAHAAVRRTALKDGTYDRLLKQQKGTCALPSCNKTPATSAKNTSRLDIDHDYNTMRVRGLLCRNHNLMLKRRISNSSLLRELADYLDSAN